LNREEGALGVFHSSGALKILNFPLHPLIALVFKLEYRGMNLFKITNSLIVEFTRASTGLKESKDFVLGWALYVPQLTSADMLHEGEV
jgi:hypothetical protein